MVRQAFDPKRQVLTALLLLAPLLAGCLGSEEGPTTGDGTVDRGDGSCDPCGTIAGSVGSELFQAIPKARVTLPSESGEREVTTDPSGAYRFENVPPGEHDLFVTAIGFESGRDRVTVAADTVTRVQTLLTPLPSDDPHHTTKDYVGKIDAAVAYGLEVPGQGCIIQPTPVRDVKTCSGTRYGGSNGEINPNITADVKTVIVEMVWNPAGPLGEHLSLDLMCPEVPRGNNGAVLDDQHDCFWDSTGSQSPIVHRVDASDWEEKGYDHTGFWAARVFAESGMLGTRSAGADIGAAYEQKFTIYVSVFHKEPAPEGFSGIPDT